MRDRTLEGYWWRPEAPDERIAGILTYDGSAPELRLLGAFTSRVEESRGAFNVRPVEESPVVLGEADGNAVTLVDCRQSGYNMRLGRGPTSWRQRLHVGLMLVGIWLEDPDENYFDKAVMGFDHLHSWSRLTSVEHTDEQVAGGWTSTSVRWGRQDPVETQVAEVKIALQLGVTTSEDARADGTRSTVAETASVAVTVPTPQSARELIDTWPKVFQDLLTLATDRACGLHELTLVRTDPPPDPDLPPQQPVTVQVYLSSTYRARPDDKALHPHQALFTLSDLPLEQLVPRWLAIMNSSGR